MRKTVMRLKFVKYGTDPDI